MNHKLFIGYLIPVLLLVQNVNAQYYETGQDPAFLRWKQIKTDRFTVIYPENYGNSGKLYALSLEKAYSKLLTLFPEKKFNIPVVIHNFTINSNGYVAWAPRRMELYPTPDQNGLPIAAEEQLTIHELTHVIQMSSLNQGFSKTMSWFFGEQFTGLVAALFPPWLLEGDAVLSESALSESGRGRDPSFQKHLKALLLDNRKNFSYDKILNSSYKDFVPDYYETGYQMVTWAMINKDPKIWNKVFSFTGRNPYTINPVNISMSKNISLKKKSLWETTGDTLKSIWKKDNLLNNPVTYENINPDKKGKYINYYSPVYAGGDSIISIKTSLSSVACIVLIDKKNNTEKTIHTPGLMYPWFISYAKGRLVWVETQTDPRWDNREYSVIKIMDLKSRSVTKLTHRSRYLAASLSPDGKKIAAVENTPENINKLVILDSFSGKIIKTYNPPENYYLQHPEWSADGKQISVIYLSAAGEGIMSFKTWNENWETLIKASGNNLQSAYIRNDSLFFISSESGTDNIYLLNPDQNVTALTNSKFGTTDISISGNNIIFSDYSSEGNNICNAVLKKTPDPGPVTKIKSSGAFLINSVNIKINAETDTITSKYVPVPYRKWQHPFRFHSWMPFYADISQLQTDPYSARPGFTLMSQNTLSTLISSVGYEYSTDRRNVFHSSVTWQGIYPVLETKIDYGTSPVISKLGSKVPDPSVSLSGLSFSNTLSVPLKFSSGRFSEFLRPSIEADYSNDYIYLEDKKEYNHGQTIITARLFFSNYYLSATRDIYPKWAQVIDLSYLSAPFDKSVYGTSEYVKSALYFPGIFSNNGIKICFESEKQDPVKYLYKNHVTGPRGYNNLISKKINFGSVDYVFPVLYPDINAGSLIYIKRIRGGLFYDCAWGPGNSFFDQSANGLAETYKTSNTVYFKSYGLELISDLHLLRIPYMISTGIRSSWKEFNTYPSVEFLFNIDLYGMTIGKRRI